MTPIPTLLLLGLLLHTGAVDPGLPVPSGAPAEWSAGDGTAPPPPERTAPPASPGSVRTASESGSGTVRGDVAGVVTEAASRTGTIRGRVVVESRPARRRARRYAGGAEAARTPQRIPQVVWIRGPVPGHPFAGPAAPAVAQSDTAFVPSLLVVPPGATVGFPNSDPFFHNVFSYSAGARFDLGSYARGESKDVVFDEPGMVKIFCEVHDRMRSAILVTENPFHAEVAEDGSFELTGVPAGVWTVVAWDTDRGATEMEVEVRDGAAVDIELVIG